MSRPHSGVLADRGRSTWTSVSRSSGACGHGGGAFENNSEGGAGSELGSLRAACWHVPRERYFPRGWV